MITYLIFTLPFLLVYFLLKRGQSAETPAIPHPPLHPLFGNIQTLKKLDPIQFYSLDTLTSKLGTFFKLKLGVKWVYVATGYDEIKESPIIPIVVGSFGTIVAECMPTARVWAGNYWIYPFYADSVEAMMESI